MKVVYLYPGEEAQVLDVENSMRTLQHYVEGFFEIVNVAPDWCVVCDEDGKCKGLPVSFTGNVNGTLVEFVGPVLLAGWNGADFTDIPEYVINRLCKVEAS